MNRKRDYIHSMSSKLTSIFYFFGQVVKRSTVVQRRQWRGWRGWLAGSKCTRSSSSWWCWAPWLHPPTRTRAWPSVPEPTTGAETTVRDKTLGWPWWKSVGIYTTSVSWTVRKYDGTFVMTSMPRRNGLCSQRAIVSIVNTYRMCNVRTHVR